MSVDGWLPADLEAETEWLSGPSAAGAACGFDASGWESNVWILHSMYELPGLGRGITHDDAYRERTKAGLEKPHIIGDVNLSEMSVLSGAQLGYGIQPSTDWERLRWADLADRLGILLGAGEFPPCFKWFPYRSWPVSIEPPCEGSMDQRSLDALLVHLREESPESDCIAAYGFVAMGASDEAQRCFRGPIGGIPGLVDPTSWRVGTPSNFWPADRSWFVYTDWDLWGTKVSGSCHLIERLVADPALETVHWP